jgi:3-hydroxyacyl-[acyl-carrier-protein] dehydratase
MRWIWIDKFTEFTPRTSATAVKNVSLAEEHLHDLYPAFPIVPHSLIVEGMAQTAGILVGEARDFKEKVILAKVSKATFHRLVRPGDTIAYTAKIDQLSEAGASISGTVTVTTPTDATPQPVADIELMFSHIDQNMAGLKFPEHNFVFTEQFTTLVKDFRSASAVAI